MRIIALSSSRGTTFQAILDAIAAGTLVTPCIGLVADKEERGAVAKARAAHIPVVIVERKSGENREAYDSRVDAAIRSLAGSATDDVVLAAVGWMWILSPLFVRRWKDRIINVHPSLLPKYPGAHAHDDVLAAGDGISGMTIHLIDEGVDSGRILLQKTCPVLPGDTPETLKERVQALEKEWYPKLLEMIERGEVRL